MKKGYLYTIVFIAVVSMVFSGVLAAVNAAYKKASEGELNGILDYTEEEIVSVDIIGNSHSGIVDGTSTRVILNRVAKVLVWYDNEYGYAGRLLDLATFIGK